MGNIKMSNDADVLNKTRRELHYTASELRELLSSRAYKTRAPHDRRKLTEAQYKRVKMFEDINYFGAEVSDLFEDMLDSLGRIPTQKEFIAKGLQLTSKWWISQTLKGNQYISNLSFTGEIVQACEDRLGRSYLSHVSELYAQLLLQELYPDAKVISDDIIDLVLGVDLVFEYMGKRLYIHVYKNSYWGRTSFEKKEKRGGMRNDSGEYIKFNRNFSGDISFIYDITDSDTTEMVNGIPLLSEDYVTWAIDRALNNSAVGESLDTKCSKLDKLCSWLENNFKIIKHF